MSSSSFGGSFLAFLIFMSSSSSISTPGALDWHDLELAIRGWTFLDYRKHPDASRLDREHQLKGAAARAEPEVR